MRAEVASFSTHFNFTSVILIHIARLSCSRELEQELSVHFGRNYHLADGICSVSCKNKYQA